MKPYVSILLLTFTIAFAGQTASEDTITNKHQVSEASQHVAPVHKADCEFCHRQGGDSPFTSTDYGVAEAFTYSQHVAPVHKADCEFCHRQGGDSPFTSANVHRITDTDIQMIVHWVNTDAAARDLNAAPPPKFHDDWALGDPEEARKLDAHDPKPKAVLDIPPQLGYTILYRARRKALEAEFAAPTDLFSVNKLHRSGMSVSRSFRLA